MTVCIVLVWPIAVRNPKSTLIAFVVGRKHPEAFGSVRPTVSPRANTRLARRRRLQVCSPKGKCSRVKAGLFRVACWPNRISVPK